MKTLALILIITALTLSGACLVYAGIKSIQVLFS